MAPDCIRDVPERLMLEKREPMPFFLEAFESKSGRSPDSNFTAFGDDFF
jgi:hypothetical protein